MLLGQFLLLLLFGQCGNWLVRQKESLCFDHSSSDWINWMSVSSIGFLFLCFFYISWFSLSFFHRSFLSWNMWIKKFYPHFLRISNWFQTIESIFAEPNKWKKNIYFMIQCHFYGHSLFFYFRSFSCFLSISSCINLKLTKASKCGYRILTQPHHRFDRQLLSNGEACAKKHDDDCG